jgi:hypothetical protein
MRNAMVPNAHLQLMYKTDEHVWGLAADYKVLQPKFVNNMNEKTSETLGSVSFMAYYKYPQQIFCQRQNHLRAKPHRTPDDGRIRAKYI